MMVDPYTVITSLGLWLIGMSIAIWRLPVGTCPECDHCREAKLEEQREREERASRYLGIPFCGVCGDYHHPEEVHRR